MLLRRILVAVLLAALVAPLGAWAAEPTPAQAAETLRANLLQAQMDLGHDPQAALSKLEAARARIWTGVLGGSYRLVEQALAAGDGGSAQRWLSLREFRIATRFSRPAADATLAVDGLLAGTISPADAALAFKADVLDTYQARLSEALNTLRTADQKQYPAQRAEAAALASGYFAILEPAYREQRGPAAADQALATFARLEQAARSGAAVPAVLADVEASLTGFRAAPLSNAEQVRRAGQLLRFLALVPVEYGRGVKGNTVTRDLEIQEATTFRNGAAAAFADLEPLLQSRDAAKTAAIAAGFRTLEQQLSAASAHASVPSAAEVEQSTAALNQLLREIMPAEWQKTDINGDFDVIASMLDQMETAAAAGEYDLAESARLEAYAVLEAGPEARLVVFAPQFKAPIEDLFWYGQNADKGLAHLIGQGAPLSAIKQSRAALDTQLAQAQEALGGDSSPAAVASNAAIIVFREGLEAVLILASLLGSLKMGDNRKLRRPIWLGAALAFLATVLTWLLARGILQSLARYGEKLEAIVSLVAIGVLLLITNWFFHKVYWTGWMANFHAKKRSIIGGAAGLWLGLIMLGFTSIYREGFETVLFLQALVLEAGTAVVLGGVAVGLLGTLLVGLIVFVLQAKLPHKKMLIATGVLIGVVLLQMVGNTVHVMQVVGWLPLHPIRSLELPYWVGMWFGLYATWEGIALQIAAGAFVIGSYVLAEYVQHRRVKVAVQAAAPQLEVGASKSAVSSS